MKEANIVTLKDILDMEPGDRENAAWINDEFEAVVSGVKLANGKGPNRATLSQASSPNTKLTGNFWGVDPSEFDGKLCRFSGQGMKRTAYQNKFKKIIQQVDLGDKAIIEIVGESVDSQRPLPQSRASTPDNGRDAAARGSGANGGHPVTYRRIIFDYLRALGITHKAYNAMKEEYDLPDISNDELCTITTGRLISLARGETIPEEAFSDMRPVAKPNGTSQKELDNTPDQEWGDDSGEDKPTEPKKAAASWKSFVHPKRKVKLGDMDEADQLKLARWGLTLGDEPDLDEDAMPFYKSVMDMAKDRKWDSPNACLIASLGASTEYSEEKFLDEDVLSRFGLSNMDDMPEEDAAEFIGDFDAVLESIVEIGEKRMKARAKGKKKPAVSVPD